MEHFSCMWGMHEWLKALCTATGLGFISNFDGFWTRSHLYKADGLHPNWRGANEMARNYKDFLSKGNSSTIKSALNNAN